MSDHQARRKNEQTALYHYKHLSNPAHGSTAMQHLVRLSIAMDKLDTEYWETSFAPVISNSLESDEFVTRQHMFRLAKEGVLKQRISTEDDEIADKLKKDARVLDKCIKYGEQEPFDATPLHVIVHEVREGSLGEVPEAQASKKTSLFTMAEEAKREAADWARENGPSNCCADLPIKCPAGTSLFSETPPKGMPLAECVTGELDEPRRTEDMNQRTAGKPNDPRPAPNG